ncbi:hypothetical protein K491DRAFT_784469 [Lophiostoma macrostomum CBS 122681]|uniref:Uncharacterized protein n=1 Tax=Lophiostoma macrostomum CBS 122681 TaxID=1314788 RepID=A0A6A6SK98_9PLEO|nr:hypothetical protein K491DRAFT_784469 [Lophiostoma macrostomum CBS 122681]
MAKHSDTSTHTAAAQDSVFLSNNDVKPSHLDPKAISTDTKVNTSNRKATFQGGGKLKKHIRLRESKEHHHQRFERRHDRRQAERARIAAGTAVPPPDAGPNWAKKREQRLAKYAKNTERRHKKHEKRVRDAEEAKSEGAGKEQGDKNSGRAK